MNDVWRGMIDENVSILLKPVFKDGLFLLAPLNILSLPHLKSSRVRKFRGLRVSFQAVKVKRLFTEIIFNS
jgi:hypothetical protein